MSKERARRAQRYAWLLCALPGVLLLGILWYAMLSRFGYAYDLEWMEGGLLAHAERLRTGAGIYVEPSVEFIPYLYTPLYPALLAALGNIFELNYQLARFVSLASIAAIIALFYVIIVRMGQPQRREAAWCGAALAAGVFAATYPWVEGWYDIARADSLFLAMALAGIVMVQRLARSPGATGILKLGAAALVLGLSFFAKQTGVFFVAIGGAVLLVSNWRRVPLYVAITGCIGLGGTWLMNRSTDGWFWTYVFEVHQAHDFNMDRVVASFRHILFKFPAVTGLIIVTLVLVGIDAIHQRAIPKTARVFVTWALIFAIATVLGAVSWGTQWAHFNAFIPAMACAAIAAGCALPALGGLTDPRIARLAPLPAAALLAIQVAVSLYSPSRFIPSHGDQEAGDRLIQRIAGVEGEVLVPFHPWYAHLAGKSMYVHRMGLLDVTVGAKRWPIRDLREAIAGHRFAAIFLDNRPPRGELPGLTRHYRIDDYLSSDEAPKVYTGAGAAYGSSVLVPRTVWVPATELVPPENVTVVDSFESGQLHFWQRTGAAWGRRPQSKPLPKQGYVARYGGRYYATSFHGGDAATGSLTSKPFEITGNLMTLRVSGGNDAKRLRVELSVDSEVVHTATGEDSERMREVTWNVAPYLGKQAVLRLVDEATDSWGHLNVDEIWLHSATDD